MIAKAALLHPSLTHERVEWHLWNWERWINSSRLPGLMPSRANGFAVCAPDVDETLDNLNRGLGDTCDRAIRELPPPMRMAIHAHHHIAVWRGEGDRHALYVHACARLGRSLYLRGMV